MGRGKIEIKKIENHTNRQVTFSKRRNGIMKKAQELTVLCDAEVSLIMLSSTGKLYEFTSSTTTTKKIFDRYQKTKEIDLWSTHYEKMQKHLEKLREINNRLRRDIRQRLGKDLNGLSMEELWSLEQTMSSAVNVVREKKEEVIKRKTNTTNKKVKSLKQSHENLLLKIDAIGEGCDFMENKEVYESAIAIASGVPNLYAFCLHRGHLVDPVAIRIP